MLFFMRNIYESRHYKLYILIPIALMLISIYFVTRIQLDSSLRGGISVQLQTSANPNIRAVSGMIDSNITGAQASVAKTPTGLEITLVANQSLANAETSLLSLYGAYSNYSSYSLNLTLYQSELKSNPGNSTLAGLIASASKGQNVSVSQMHAAFQSEISSLAPVYSNLPSFNASDYSATVDSAQQVYSNASTVYENNIIKKLKAIVPFTVYSYNDVTPTLGAFFLSQIRTIIIAAFVLVAIAVFMIFRTPIPSFAVVFGAANDIIVALGVMGLLGIPLGIASVGGLLMLLGYSIDTDMLSSIRVIKRTDSTPEARAYSSFKTGATMTVTAILSFGVLLVVAYLAYIPTYIEISSVVMAGLLADLVTTWLANMPIILWYKKRKDGIR